jgi:GTP cyclohydrolase I
MSIRGVQAPGSRTLTSRLLGVLRSDPRSRQEFLALAGPSAQRWAG